MLLVGAMNSAVVQSSFAGVWLLVFVAGATALFLPAAVAALLIRSACTLVRTVRTAGTRTKRASKLLGRVNFEWKVTANSLPNWEDDI